MVRRRLQSVLILSSIAACSSNPPYDPFRVEPIEALEHSRVVALAPIRAHPDLHAPEEILAMVDQILVDSLRSAGFSVVDPAVFSDIWEPILDEVGGFFNPRTGEVIPDKRDLAMGRLRDELDLQFGVGAIMYPELQIVDAPYSDGKAHWDGASQSVAGFWDQLGEGLSALADALAGDPHQSTLPSGVVDALSIQVTLEDLQGNELYTNWGGVEVIADEESGESHDENELFKNVERLQRAASIALKPLIEKAANKEAASTL